MITRISFACGTPLLQEIGNILKCADIDKDYLVYLTAYIYELNVFRPKSDKALLEFICGNTFCVM